MNHYTRWLELKKENPGKYARDIAGLMNISEAELTFARVGHDAWRLRGEVREILSALEAVGETKCICRNEYAVHEQVGAFTNQHLNGHAGLVLNPRALDLRLFLNQWASTFHISETTAHGERQSIQFFDHQGDALLKVYTTQNTLVEEWAALLTRFIFAENPPLALQPANNSAPAAVTVDAQTVDQEWRAMTDVHQFFGLLKRHELTRQQAFNLVGDDLACKVSNSALAQLLDTARQDGNEIMVFVGNRGCVQIFTGVIEKLVPMKGWLNIFNPTFTLHLLEESVAETWVTRKPTADGHVTSLELFAADGTQIAQLYGQRTEGEPEQTQWRTQIDALGAQPSLVARDSTSQWPAAATALPDVGYLRQLNAEGILATRPTLVLASAQAQPSLVLKQLEQSNVRVVTIPASNDLNAIDEKVRVIAEATHREADGETLRATLRQELATLPSSELNKRVLFILNHGGMTAMAAGQQTGADAAIRAAGLRNAMQGVNRYQPLSQEGVIASQPDLVVISLDGVKAMGGEDNLWALPGLAQTPAGRNKQVLQVDDMALLGFSVRTPQAILQLRAKAEQLP